MNLHCLPHLKFKHFYFVIIVNTDTELLKRGNIKNSLNPRFTHIKEDVRRVRDENSYRTNPMRWGSLHLNYIEESEN